MATSQCRIGVLVGSLRRGAFSKKIAQALVDRAPDGMECSFIAIDDLPLYNEDLDRKPPAPWTRFRDDLQRCDALLFVTPEYNRSMPGCLKNATDIGSRPEGQNLFAGLPAAVVSVSPYALGGFGANHALRQNFVYLDLAVMQQPEAYIGNAKDVMDARGKITKRDTDVFLTKFMSAFGAWIGKTRSASEDFDTFLARREKASVAYINADAGPLLEMSGTDQATFFPPDGRWLQGAKAVNASNRKGAANFRQGSKGRFEILQSGASGGVGFWTGIQHAKVMMKGKDAAVKMALRVTEVFRVEGGEWKLVHRHADNAE